MLLKRIFDILFASTILIIIFPFCLPIVILLKLTGEGKIFYVQERVGRNKKAFGIIKFATMLQNSSSLPGGDVTSADDPRILPMGKFLRKTKINELPQFFNILKGEMSVIGPRPTTFKNYSYYEDDIQHKIRNVKPGITGIGSIVFRDEENFLKQSKKDAVTCYKEDIAPFKGDLEVWYAERQNFFLDISLILITIIVVLFPKSKILKKTYKDLPKNKYFLK